MGRIVAVVLVGAAGAGAAAVGLAAPSPTALRASIFAAARKQHSVHYREHGAAGTVLRQDIVADVAGTRGIQRVTFTIRGKRARFTIIVANRLAYVHGNAYALQAELGLRATQAARYQGRWISVPPANGKYKSLAASVTLPSFLHDIYPTAPLAVVTTTVGGRKFTGVRGTNRQPGVNFVEALFPDSNLLPLAVSDVDASRDFFDGIRISRWNEPVRVTAPANAVPISAVQAG